MKILCICQGGNVRSVAMAQHLKEKGHEAIAIGMDHTSKETYKMLIDWSDKIIDMRIYFKDYWHDPRHHVLKKEVKQIWLEEKPHLE